MVVGERGAGKTSLIKTLVNWRVREMTGKGMPRGAGVVVCNLDVGEGGLTIPGTMSIVSMGQPLPTTTPVAAMGTSISSGPPVPFPSPSSAEWTPAASVDAYAPPVNPLIYFHGHTSPNSNPAMFDLLLKRTGKSLKRKLEEGGVEGWRAGVIVDTPGEWAEKKGMQGVSRAVRELESEFGLAAKGSLGADAVVRTVNILLVVGSERLYVEMKKLMATNKTVSVVRVPKSDGVRSPLLLAEISLTLRLAGLGARSRVPRSSHGCSDSLVLLRRTRSHAGSPLALLNHRQV